VVKPKCLIGLCGQTNSGGRVSAGHDSVWLFKQCNQVVFSVPSAVRNRASVVLCAGVQC
jgi:hypothetical protein